MNPPIHLRFRYTERDYLLAIRAHHTSRVRTWVDTGMALLLVGLGIFLLPSPDSRWAAMACFVSVGLVLLLRTLALYVIPLLMFRREPKFRDEYSLRFADEGIHFRTPHIDSHLEWGMYVRVLIDAHTCILYYSRRQFTVLPKRVFKSEEQREAFERMLEEHVKVITRRG